MRKNKLNSDKTSSRSVKTSRSPAKKDPSSPSYSKKAGRHIGRDRINNCRHIAEKGYFGSRKNPKVRKPTTSCLENEMIDQNGRHVPRHLGVPLSQFFVNVQTRVNVSTRNDDGWTVVTRKHKKKHKKKPQTKYQQGANVAPSFRQG